MEKHTPTHQPIQPLALDGHGTLRFQENSIVVFLLEQAQHGVKCDMNEIAKRYATGQFHVEDMRQFAQLIGYSHSGYGDLSYVDGTDYDAAIAMYNDPELKSIAARLAEVENKLITIKDIVNWQASKPVDNAPKPATQSAAAKQDAEVKAKIEKAKAESVAQSAIETPVVVAQLTDEDKARIKAQESWLQAMYIHEIIRAVGDN